MQVHLTSVPVDEIKRSCSAIEEPPEIVDLAK